MFNKKILSPFMAVILALICCGVSVFGTYTVMKNNSSSVEGADLYQQAITDAVVAEDDEILPLVDISENSDMVTWKDGRVLMLTFHRFPDSYPEGEDVTLQWGYVWTFSEKEFLTWYEKNGQGVTDWDLRIKQLLGMPEWSENSFITAVWVSPDDLLRPAYVTDITKQMTNAFDEDQPESDDFINWFNSNAVYSYCGNSYPWTRLGYTYDWADNGTEYGVSEFLVENGANVTVEFTKSVDEWIGELSEAA